MLNLPQVKPNLTSSMKTLSHELLNNLSKTFDFVKSGNIGKVSNLGRDKAYCPVSLPYVFGTSNSKLHKKSCHSFWVLSNFTWYFYFPSYLLQKIVGGSYLYTLFFGVWPLYLWKSVFQDGVLAVVFEFLSKHLKTFYL